jgi:outer membrane lipase/esterase
MVRSLRALTFALAFSVSPAFAQNFNQTIVFGDSSVDSGWYKHSSTGNLTVDAAIAASGWRAAFTSAGTMNSEFLAGFFGTTASPQNVGGTNFATGGARDNIANGPGSFLFFGAVPTTTQIANYLAANNGIANPNALYLISSGGNDQTYAFDHFSPGSAAAGGATTKAQYFANVADALAASIAQLQAAGARYIIVRNSAFGTSPLTKEFVQDLWNDLAAKGVNFIPADLNAVRAAITANPSAFGFTNISPGVAGGPNTGACLNPFGLSGAWALTCSAANLVSPNAQNTYLFADNEHLTTAGQRITADYYYSLIVAPSEISFLAENAVKARTRFVTATQNQIDVSQDQRGPAGFNAWVTGDISHLGMNNYDHFPDDPGTPVMLAAGVDFRLSRQLIVGGVISTSTQRSSFSTTGNFTDDEIAGSLYAGYRGGPWWGNAILTYGHLAFAVNRDVPIGITVQHNNGSTDGSDWSLATEGGYKFRNGWFTHGPIIGLTLQRVNVSDFTESGSFTSLSFGDQVRNSAISALGYRATIDWGAWRPFGQVVWNHELANTDRDVTAFLTTVTAPGYSMPAVVLGRDWGTASIGTTWKVGKNMTALGAFTAEFGQRDATSYGAQLGLNIAF